MQKLSEKLRGEIAIALWEARVMETGLVSPRKLGDELHRASKETGYSVDVLKAFYASFFEMVYGRMFGFSQVTIEAN